MLKINDHNDNVHDVRVTEQHVEEEHKPLVWKDLSYSVKVSTRKGLVKKSHTKILLQNISGFVNKGELLAIIGGSGAGKSTLLDVLAGRKTGGKQQGQLLYYGKPRDRYFQRHTAYVTQDDVHLGNLTVRENLYYAALLRLPQSLPLATKRDRVQAIIEMMGLQTCAETRVGNTMTRGISGGESRRLSVAIELLAGPEIVFLDEPTSGLDSTASFHVIKLLRKLADSQKISVIFSIHQPSPDVFKLFDKLMLLGKGEEGFGKTVYFGQSSMAIDHFAALGHHCPDDMNPADFLSTMAGGLRGTQEMEERDNEAFRDRDVHSLPLINVDDQAQRYQESGHYQQLMSTLDSLEKLPPPPPPPKHKEQMREYATTTFFQFRVLLVRSVINMYRSPSFFMVRILRLVAMAALISSTYYQIGTDQKGVQDRISLIFFCVTASFMNGVALLPTFIEERDVFVRERAAKLYRIIAYFTSSILTVIPFDILNGIIFSSMVYWITNLNPGVYNFFFFFFVFTLTSLAVGGYVLWISAFSATEQEASTFAPLIFSVFMMFAGFLVLPDNIPAWYIWAYYISPLRYCMQLLLYNEFHDRTYDCDDDGGNVTACAFPTGEEVLSTYSAEDDNRILFIFVLLIFHVTFRTLNYLTLVFKRFDKR